MIAVLLAALLPGVYWARGPESADVLRRAGIEQIYVAAGEQQAWRSQSGIDVEGVDPDSATKLVEPGVQFQMNRASATRSPWVTTNAALLLRSPDLLFLYDAKGPHAELAAAEAFAFGAAKAIIATDEAGLAPLARMRKFLRGVDAFEAPPIADIGVIDDGSPESAEMMSLLARGNLLFRIVKAADPNLKLNVQIGSSEYPRTDAAEPHKLAAKIRSQLTDEKRSLRIYGSTVVIGRVIGDANHVRVHLMNYSGAQRPVNGIRVRVLGCYQRQKFSASGVDAAELLDARVREDATEFTIPEMRAYAVVDLFR